MLISWYLANTRNFIFVKFSSLEDLADQMNEDNETKSMVKHDEFGIGSLCLAKVCDDER